MTVNDVIFHVAQEDLPFGGVGPSGMGSYHGQTASASSATARRSTPSSKRPAAVKALRPPYGPAIRKYLAGAIGARTLPLGGGDRDRPGEEGG